jgi:methionyl-tRNA formyltransferase
MARLAFFGTPDVAVITLDALVAAGHELECIVTRPDVRRGRGGAFVASPVKVAAERLGLHVTDDPREIERFDLDAGVVVAYGALLSKNLVEAVPLVNLHFSLLPRWRGAAPLERAILAGDAETGVCLMQVVEALDAGGIYAEHRTAVDDKTLEQLRAELSHAGTHLLVEQLAHGTAWLAHPTPQRGEPTYATKLTKQDRQLDFDRPAIELGRVVRLGGAYTFVNGKRLRIEDAIVVDGTWGAPGIVDDGVVACQAGGLRLVRVQPESGRSMEASDWLRGIPQVTPLMLGDGNAPKVGP